ncbi:MAG: SMI1/KNR4 family protein [Spirochaetia bacterium]|nr:SMI1/KNR4 family protein [Spirochaetia bacterium]
MKFLYEGQLKLIKKNLTLHNENVGFRTADEIDLFYLRSCKIPESVINFYENAEPDDVVEIQDARIWPISVLKLENEKMEPGNIIFPLGYFVIGTTIFGDCYCLDLRKLSAKKEPVVVIAYHDRQNDHASKNTILENMKEVAKSFDDFLSRFAKGKLLVD